MKRKFLLSFAAVSAAIILTSGIAYTSHSPGAKTGSPADGANCTACHAGTTQTATGWITTNIPSSGYVPGTKYTITLTGKHTGVVKFGFELTAENAQNAKIGTFSITNSTETQLTNMMHAVTHTSGGLTPTSGSKTWLFDWTAPVAGSGDVTFYASLNAADGNGSSSGDVIYNTNATFIENPNIGIENVSQSNSFSIFPNPASDVLNLKLNNAESYELSVLDLTGKQMLTEIIRSQTEVYRLDISELPQGVYFIHLKSEHKLLTKQFVKQ